MEIPFKPFSYGDWNNYPGCEGEPEIAEIMLPLEGKTLPCTVVVDDNGINLDYWDEPLDKCHDFQFELVAGMGKAIAKHLLTLIALDTPSITIEDLMALGFTYSEV